MVPLGGCMGARTLLPSRQIWRSDFAGLVDIFTWIIQSIHLPVTAGPSDLQTSSPRPPPPHALNVPFSTLISTGGEPSTSDFTCVTTCQDSLTGKPGLRNIDRPR